MKEQEFQQAETLSACLDALNEGLLPKEQEQDVWQLVEMAAIVKDTYIPPKIPQNVLNNIVGTAARELKKQRRQRQTKWLTGSLSAAAVLFIICTQFLWPHTPPIDIAQQVQQIDNQQVGHSEENFSGTQFLARESPSNNLPEAAGRESLKEKERQPSETESPQQVAMLSQQPTYDTAEQPPEKRSLLMANRKFGAAVTLPGTIYVMAIPDQQPSSIQTDAHNGVVQQIYNRGQANQIMIRQTPLIEGEQHSDAWSVPSGYNSFMLKTDQYYIVIVGKQQQEELAKVAKSLVLRNVEQK